MPTSIVKMYFPILMLLIVNYSVSATAPWQEESHLRLESSDDARVENIAKEAKILCRMLGMTDCNSKLQGIVERTMDAVQTRNSGDGRQAFILPLEQTSVEVPRANEVNKKHQEGFYSGW